MMQLERLVFLTPSIKELLSSPIIQSFCVSPIRSTQPYLKCCYISFQNFLIELLEVTDINQANQFAFYEEAKNLLHTKWVGTGLHTHNLDLSIETLKQKEIFVEEYFTSTTSLYKKGYKHKSALLNLQWYKKFVYISEYDPQFFNERESEITTDICKKQKLSILNPEALDPYNQPPAFLQHKDSVPCIEVVSNSDTTQKFINCEWLILKFN